jgi:hypothetical protein
MYPGAAHGHEKKNTDLLKVRYRALHFDDKIPEISTSKGEKGIFLTQSFKALCAWSLTLLFRAYGITVHGG